MRSLQSSSHRRGWVSASIHDVLTIVVFGVIQESLNSRLGKRPSTGIKRFLLSPDDSLSVRVLVEVFLELLPWEWVKLLNTSNGDVLEVLVGTVFVESGVDLTCAKDDALDFIWLGDGFTVLWVGDDPAELRFTGEVLDR